SRSAATCRSHEPPARLPVAIGERDPDARDFGPRRWRGEAPPTFAANAIRAARLRRRPTCPQEACAGARGVLATPATAGLPGPPDPRTRHGRALRQPFRRDGPVVGASITRSLQRDEPPDHRAQLRTVERLEQDVVAAERIELLPTVTSAEPRHHDELGASETWV